MIAEKREVTFSDETVVIVMVAQGLYRLQKTSFYTTPRWPAFCKVPLIPGRFCVNDINLRHSAFLCRLP